MTRSTRKSDFGASLLQAGREALAYKRGELRDVKVTRRMVTVRGVDVIAPPEYRDRDIQRIRQRLGLSQAVFAQLLGASASTVRAWERGAREPSEMARRLIALVERDPEVFEQDLVPAGSVAD